MSDIARSRATRLSLLMSAGVCASGLIAAATEILTDNGVRAQGYPDTLAVWQGKPAP